MVCMSIHTTCGMNAHPYHDTGVQAALPISRLPCQSEAVSQDFRLAASAIVNAFQFADSLTLRLC